MKKLVVMALMVVIGFSFVTYTWIAREDGAKAETSQEPPCQIDQDTPCDMVKFEAVVNGMSSVDVFVCINMSDGLTEKEAELIVGTTFILVKGDYVTHRLETLDFDDSQIEAHYAWGYNENDVGHVFDVIVDLTTLQITVSHCF